MDEEMDNDQLLMPGSLSSRVLKGVERILGQKESAGSAPSFLAQGRRRRERTPKPSGPPGSMLYSAAGHQPEGASIRQEC